jgi:hypothetical protein
MSNIQSLIDSVRKTQEFIEQFRKDNELLAQIYGDKLRQYLADRGWYIAGILYPGQMAKLSQAIEQNSENEIEEFLKEHVRRLMSEVEKDICKAWPIRAPLLKDAFEAHKSKKYSLSIPVLLAQVDGICYDSLKSFLFTKPKAKTRIKKLLEGKSPTPLSEAFLALIINDTTLMVNTKIIEQKRKSQPHFGTFNRHAILHGIDCKYQTEGNSLRAVALLSYLQWAVSVIAERETKKTT